MGPRPQTLMFTLLGRHVLHRRVAVASGTCIAVLGRLGVGEEAARSTLNRMVLRGHLERHRRGRRAYLALTPRTRHVLAEGETRIFSVPPVRAVDDAWTLLSFSIPESRRSERHRLRTALSWRGFGPLRNGLWLAPGAVDVAEVLDALDLRQRVDGFVGHPTSPTDIRRVVAETWDLDTLAARYRAFTALWGGPGPGGEGWPGGEGRPSGGGQAGGALAAQLRLITDWRLLILDDPRLPLVHLPGDWPAQDAFALFLRRHDEVRDRADAEFADLLDALPLDHAHTGQTVDGRHQNAGR